MSNIESGRAINGEMIFIFLSISILNDLAGSSKNLSHRIKKWDYITVSLTTFPIVSPHR